MEKKEVTYGQAFEAFNTLAQMQFDEKNESRFSYACARVFQYLKNNFIPEYNMKINTILANYALEDEKGALVKKDGEFQFSKEKTIQKEQEIINFRKTKVEIMTHIVPVTDFMRKKYHIYILDILNDIIVSIPEEKEENISETSDVK